MTLEPQQLIDLAQKAGASHAEVYQSRSQSRPVFFESNRLKQLESAQAEGTALRIWKAGCPGLAVAYGEIEPQLLVERAIALAQLNEPEEIELAEARREIHPNVGEDVAVDRLIEAGKSAIATLRDAFPEVICGGEFSCGQDTMRLVNSLGLYCEYRDTTLSYFLGVEWIKGEDFLAVYEGETTRGTLNLEAVLAQILQRLQWAKNNVEAPTGRVPVILTPNATSLLWGTVEAALNGKRVLEKSSPWSDRQGERVAVPELTLSQQPNFQPYDCPFDDEGSPTQVLSLIETGLVGQFYCDRKTAKQLNQANTGNGFRPGLGSFPTPDLINLVVEPRSGSLTDFIGQLDRAIVIDQMLGEGAEISGDFSVNIDLGYRVEKGHITGRVKDTMVAGNVYRSLKELAGIGCDRVWSGAYYTPSLLLEGLSVVG